MWILNAYGQWTFNEKKNGMNHIWPQSNPDQSAKKTSENSSKQTRRPSLGIGIP